MINETVDKLIREKIAELNSEGITLQIQKNWRNSTIQFKFRKKKFEKDFLLGHEELINWKYLEEILHAWIDDKIEIFKEDLNT